MSELTWTWFRINVMNDGSIELLPPRFTDDKTALEDRRRLQNQVFGWRALDVKRGGRLLAVNTDVNKWEKDVLMTFVIYERRKAKDA